MKRTLLASTAAAVLLLSAAAIAQDASSSMDPSAMDSSMMSSEPMSSEMVSSEMMSSEMMSSKPMSSMMSSETPMDMSSEVMVSAEPMAPFDITTGYTQVDTDNLASRIIGQPVYDGTAADANNLGNINDLVLNESGAVQAVVIGVGGFLGLGEKQVAVAYSALQWVVAADNTERFVIDATVDQLTNAPDFIVTEDAPVDGDAMATSSAM